MYLSIQRVGKLISFEFLYYNRMTIKLFMTINLIYILKQSEETWFLYQLHNTEIQFDQKFWEISPKNPAISVSVISNFILHSCFQILYWNFFLSKQEHMLCKKMGKRQSYKKKYITLLYHLQIINILVFLSILGHACVCWAYLYTYLHN